MHSPEAQGFARFGGALLAVSLVLPYFAISFAGFAGVSFRLWTVDKGAFVLVAAFALMALAQIRFSTRSTTALIYLIVGGIFTAVIIYKVWISPPGSAPLGDLGGAGSGTLTIDGKSGSAGSFSTRDILEAMGIEMKASYGAFVAMLGSAFFTVGAFLDWRGSGDAPASAQRFEPMAQGQYQGEGQFHQGQYPGAGTSQLAHQPPSAPVPAAPPDPFAPPADPFAAPAQTQDFPQDPFAPPAPPAQPAPPQGAPQDPFAPPAPPAPGPAAPSAPAVPQPPAPGPAAPTAPTAPQPPAPATPPPRPPGS